MQPAKLHRLWSICYNFLTDLCFGKDPASCQYAGSKELRQHLVTCFENGHMLPFLAISALRKSALTKDLTVYCKCRLPYVLEHVKHPTGEEVTCMVKCYICDNFYHHSCMNLTVEDAKKIKSTKEMWYCDYKGCNAAFGQFFDSDSD